MGRWKIGAIKNKKSCSRLFKDQTFTFQKRIVVEGCELLQGTGGGYGERLLECTKDGEIKV